MIVQVSNLGWFPYVFAANHGFDFASGGWVASAGAPHFSASSLLPLAGWEPLVVVEQHSEKCKSLWAQLRNVILFLLPHSAASRKSQGQPRFKGRGNRCHFLRDRAAKSHCKRVWIQGGEKNCGPFCNLLPGLNSSSLAWFYISRSPL